MDSLNIALVTIAYNGYGQFVNQWLGFLNNSKLIPSQVIVVLGHEHGCPNPAELIDKFPRLPIQIFETDEKPTMGRLRNVAVSKTNTEWVMYLSVDDMLLPGCLTEVSKVAHNADYISLSWITTGIGEPDRTHYAVTPKDCKKHRGKGFIIGHSPFRRKFWQKIPYENHDLPNAPFILGMLRQNARFEKISRPGTIYLRRPDSHSKTVLQGLNQDKEVKRKAVFYKRQLETYIRMHL